MPVIDGDGIASVGILGGLSIVQFVGLRVDREPAENGEVDGVAVVGVGGILQRVVKTLVTPPVPLRLPSWMVRAYGPPVALSSTAAKYSCFAVSTAIPLMR